MTSEGGFLNRSWVKIIERAISFLANIAVISGIIFASIQITQSNKSEKRRIAIEAVSPTRSNDFLKAYARLKTAISTDSIDVEDQTSLIDDLNYVMNVYDNVAIMYISDLADRCIIKNAVYSAIREFSSIVDTLSYPKEYRKNFDTLLALMKQESCMQDTSRFHR